MTNILNPYIAGAPVVETSMFFGREDIFGWIERSLTGKFVNHILVLHGQRRVGKTSVLKQIPRHIPRHYIQVFFDLQGRTNTTLDRFLWWMASEIVRTLKKECDLDLPKIDRSAFADPDSFINDFLPSLRALIGDKVLLLTFDEFDTLDRPDIQDSLARPLIAYLRRLMEIEGLNFIFSIGSSGNKLENMQASYTDFFKSALYRKVSFLTKDDCVRLITKPVEGTITYEPAAVDKISHFTSGHPYFTQLTCHELFSRCQKTGSRTITSQDVDSILEDVIERGTVNLKFVWDEASDLEKWILAALAQEEGAPLKRIHQILKDQGLRTNDADLNSAILHLRDKDVLDADNGFIIQLMKLWLQTNRPMDRVREELVQTNPIADRYLEIGDEYRERGENQQAIQSYEQALAVQENNIRALQNIATIHSSQNSFDEAVKYLARILLIDEENIAARQGFFQAQIYLAKKAMKEGDEVKAENAIRSILMIAPAHAEATKLFAQIYVQKAESLLRNGLEDQALEEFETAIRISPDDKVIRSRYEKLITDKKDAQVKVWMDKAEKSLSRQRWDEAASMVEEAINIDPENPELQKQLLAIKDAPRQEKIKSYRQEAEQAIAKGNYPKATSAIQTAILLAPEDSSLKEWLESIQSDQANAQLRLLQSQADQAEAAGNWETAITAREAALKLDPQNERLVKALEHTKDEEQKQHLNSLRMKIELAKQDQNWEAALSASKEYLQLAPHDQQVQNDLSNLKIQQRKSRLASLISQAQSASKAEKWEDAIQHWQAYLAEKPEDGARVEKLIDQAKQKATLLKEYETAQAHIRKHQYNRAIHLLQGIIAKDPTYKASSRLLVEAVEANKERKPIWKKPWIYAGGAVLIVAVVVIIMLPRIKEWMNPSQEPTSVVEVMETQTEPGDSVFIPNPFGYALDRRVLYQISETGSNLALTKKPTFQDYFDEGNPQTYWQTLLNENHIYLVSDMFKIYAGAWYTNEFLYVNNFLLEFEYFTENGLENNITHIDINSGSEIYYRFSISNNGRYKERINNVEGEWKLVPNWTSLKLENENTIKVKFIKNENEMTVFVNEVPLVYHNEFIENDNPQIILNFEGDQNQSVIWLQSIRLWNLDEPDFLSTLIGNIENINPTFQDDFEIFSPQPYWDDLLTGQKIILKGSGWEMFGGNYFANDMLLGNEFVIEYDYVPQNYDANIFINTSLLGNNPDFNFTFSLDNLGQYKYKFGQVETGLNSIPSWSDTLEQNNFNVRVNLIVAKNTLAVYVNNTAVVLEENIVNNGELTTEIRFDETADNYSIAILNTIKFWNLEGMEFEEYTQPVIEEETSFSDPINTYINENPPTFEDDFSTTKSEWGNTSSGVPVSSYIQGGMISHMEFLLDPGDSFPTNGLFDARDFAIQFYFDTDEEFNPDINFQFRSDSKSSGYNLSLRAKTWELKKSIDSTFIANGTYPGTYGARFLNLIVKDNNLAIYLDRVLVYEGNDYDSDFSSNRFVNLDSENQTIGFIYSFKFWNLDGLEFDQGEIETQVSQTNDDPPWVTDFVNPVLDYVENRPPDFEDNFENSSSIWKTPGIAEYQKSVVDGEMIVNGAVENTMITYHDYMIDVNIRHINGYHAGIEFTNGSLGYCKVLVGYWGESVHFSCSDPTDFGLTRGSSAIVNLRLIVKGSKIAVIVNQQPVAYIEDELFRLYRGEKPKVSLTSNDGTSRIAFSNFRAWNLTMLEIP